MSLLTGQPARLADAARAYLAGVEEAGGVVFVSNLVVSEAYFACQHHYGMPKADVLAGLLVLLSKPTLIVRTALLELLAIDGLATANPGFLDRLIHSEYAADGLRLVTFEKAANRLSGAIVLS